MWRVIVTKIIESKSKAIEMIAEMAYISEGEEVEITDFNGRTYKLKKQGDKNENRKNKR
jgi:hypothetical protein